MIEGIRKLFMISTHKTTEWYKNGRRAALRTMRVFGDTESGAVRMSRYYRTPIFSILINRRVYLHPTDIHEEGDGPGKYRVVSSERIVTLGSRAGRPLVSFHLPLSSRRLGSDEAVEEVQRLISENTDFDLTACTLHR